jgi:hypothetical protein
MKISPTILWLRVMLEDMRNEAERIRHPPGKFRAFWDEYERLSELGACDGAGATEFWRVLEEWRRAGWPEDLERFIRWRANETPSDNEVMH